ncbi:hypothetical protein BC937DRAFT_93533 [Endogone sp. FLAS-F59071]|nr:hypothetical protein BC937DRAFT_93533 [Endogone sp. FLAS-F59071]|eukprot:RUS14632.1 hypothetical protein BC937DRAFT_93533 [Endogone sp. FLAS-F59071]
MRAFLADRDNKGKPTTSTSSYHSSSSTLAPASFSLASQLPSFFLFSRRAIQNESSASDDVIRYFHPSDMPVHLQMLIAGAVCSLSEFVGETVPVGTASASDANVVVVGMDGSGMRFGVWQEGVEATEREREAEDEGLCLVVATLADLTDDQFTRHMKKLHSYIAFWFRSLSDVAPQALPQLAKELQPYIKCWFSDGAGEEFSPAMHLHPPRLVTSQPRQLHGAFIDVVDMIDGIKAVSLNRNAASVARADRMDLFILGVCALHDNRVLYTDFEPECTWNLVMKSKHIANGEPSNTNAFPRYQAHIPDHELLLLRSESAVHLGVDPAARGLCRTDAYFATHHQLILVVLIEVVGDEADNGTVTRIYSAADGEVVPGVGIAWPLDRDITGCK